MILFSFDIEEFDAPKEKGADFSLEEGLKVSKVGTNNILDILKANDVCATLFCTANFVQGNADVIKRAIAEGHEIACHGVDHWNPKDDDPKISKQIIEAETGLTMRGYRQPRMFPVSEKLIEECGYVYNSSLNPACIPGKYIHLDVPRTPFMQGKVLQIPASVSPHLRVPAFWLSLHDFPLGYYKHLAKKIVKHDGYFTTYFHPWEFVDHPPELKKYLLPIVNHNIGTKMCKRLDNVIKFLKDIDGDFATYSTFADKKLGELNGN